MPVKPLPSHPNLDHLKYQAKDLLTDHAARTPAAAQRLREFHPRWTGATAHGMCYSAADVMYGRLSAGYRARREFIRRAAELAGAKSCRWRRSVTGLSPSGGSRGPVAFRKSHPSYLRFSIPL